MLSVTVGQREYDFVRGERIPESIILEAFNIRDSIVYVNATGVEFYQALRILNNGVLVSKDSTIFKSMLFCGDEARKIIANWF